MAGTRSYVAGNFFFNLDGVKCGFVKSASGGDAVADVVVEKIGPDHFSKKHLGPPRYDGIELTIGFGMAQSLYDWIAASWKMNYARKDGAIVTADANFQARSERQFFHALVSEVTVPKLDGSSKDAAFLTVKLAPEYTRTAKASGKLTVPKMPAQKQFVASNFRFEMGGLPTARVVKVDSFTVKENVHVDPVGDVRDYQKEGANIEFPNLRVTIGEADAQPWLDWFEDFVVKGNCDDAHEKSGAIVFLAPDKKAELGRVNLHNVGIFGLRGDTSPTGEQLPRLVADLYCERMELLIGKPAIAKLKPVPTPTPPEVLRPITPIRP